MSIKISELPSASSVTSSDAIPIVQSGTTMKATVGTMLPTIATSITSSSTNDEVAGAKAVYDLNNNLSLISVNNSARLTINVPAAWSAVKLNLDNTTVTTGDYTLSNGAVIVGAKPKVVEAYFSCALDSLTTGTYNFTIKKTHNGTTTNEFVYAFSGVASINNPQGLAVFEVSESDKIEIYATKNSAGTFYGGLGSCILTVKTLSEVAPTQTRTLSTARLMNTGSLVGMGNRVEISEQVDEKVSEQVEETKTTEVDKLESEEGSGDSR